MAGRSAATPGRVRASGGRRSRSPLERVPPCRARHSVSAAARVNSRGFARVSTTLRFPSRTSCSGHRTSTTRSIRSCPSSPCPLSSSTTPLPGASLLAPWLLLHALSLAIDPRPLLEVRWETGSRRASDEAATTPPNARHGAFGFGDRRARLSSHDSPSRLPPAAAMDSLDTLSPSAAGVLRPRMR